MIRRQLLVLAGTGGVAAAAGMAWALWRHPDADRIDPGLLSLRFDRPEGGELSLSSWPGQALVLNFWATWCPPCIKELPEFDKLHRSQLRPGLVVLGLAVDGPTPVRQFLARQPVSFPVGLAGFDGIDLSRKLGNTSGALPFTVIIDRVGRIRHRKLGPTEFNELSGWVRQL